MWWLNLNSNQVFSLKYVQVIRVQKERGLDFSPVDSLIDVSKKYAGEVENQLGRFYECNQHMKFDMT